MSKILALLSGKGGSGKTTLALSMASMLSDCGVKVLLVDCDLSTNGATYFYENRLSEHDGNAASFYKIIFDLGSQENQLISINENMGFLPSITQITKKSTRTYSYKEKDEQLLQIIKNRYSKEFDIIIFDCQAGYTDTLRLILSIVDINLVVMEADAISSAAIRSLYLKIGDFLNEKKIYQVFNKATNEEYEIYSKLSGGTVFTNIETVKFDWKIRKAFSIAEIPDMKKTSADYGAQIYNICKTLFKEDDIRTKLNRYGIIIELNMNSEQERLLEDKLNEVQVEGSILRDKTKRITITVAIGVLEALICSLFFMMIEKKVFSSESVPGLLIVFVIMMLISSVFFSLISLMETTKEYRSRYMKVTKYKKQLKTVLEKKQELQEEHKMLNSKGNN